MGYNAASTAGSNWGPNNYLLRDRVARILGPIVKYAVGEKKGQLVGPDVEAWFQQRPVSRHAGHRGPMGRRLHSGLAANWVKADPLNAAYVTNWQESHPDEVAAWKKANPDNAEPKPEDLAGIVLRELFERASGHVPGCG